MGAKRVIVSTILLMSVIYVCKYLLSQEINIKNEKLSIYMGNCTWYNPNQGPDILDLSAYNNKHDIFGDGLGHEYFHFFYSPCSNWYHPFCHEPSSMSVYEENTTCDNIAYFDVESLWGNPQWVNNGFTGHHWRMRYDVFDDWSYITTLINWYCDPYLKYGEIRVGSADYYLVINDTERFYEFRFYSSSIC